VALALGLLGLGSGPSQAGLLSVPTGAEQRSPLFGAQPFKARIVLVEEFGSNGYTGVEAAASDDNGNSVAPTLGLPQAGTTSIGDLDDCHGTPKGSDLDDIIKMTELYPLPTAGGFAVDELGDDGKFKYKNAWESKVKDCLYGDDPGIADIDMPMDGRPFGQDFQHQKWDEYHPVKFFQSIMTGSRTSGGARDHYQSHGYGKDLLAGQFSEYQKDGGLYYNTVTSPYAPGTDSPAWAQPKDPQANVEGGYMKIFEGTTKGIPVNINPLNGNFPNQDTNSVWTFDGTIPLHLMMARYGEPVLFRHYNGLPIVDDVSSNKGFGTHTISTHVHNFHMPAESDGFAGAWFYPGQFFDYRWPMALAGSESINTNAADPRASAPCTPGELFGGLTCPDSGIYKVPGDYRETQTSLWFHDHMEDFTAQNVYKGNAAVFNIYSGIDRGNEEFNCRGTDAPTKDETNLNLCLPSGTAKSWGNRDYDVNLVIADKAFDQSGQLWFNPLNTGGFLGDVMTVNLVYKPYMDVRARRYRFRLLNGAVSRYIKVAVVDEKGAQVPFHMVANDGNLLEHSVAFPNSAAGTGLPTESIAERYDIVVDFAPLYANGIKKVYLVNLLEHKTGERPNAPVTLSQALNAFNGNSKTGYNGEDRAIGKFMEFRLRPCQTGTPIYDDARKSSGGCRDNSMNPALYTETVTALDPVTKKNVTKPGRVMIPMPTFTQQELAAAKHRTFVFGRLPDTATDQSKPWTISTDGGPDLTADMARISAAPVKNSVEIWHLVNKSGGWSHPAHIHFEEGSIIKKDGVAPPPWEKFGRKDMYRVGPEVNSAGQIDVAIRVRDWTGTYVEHCHNTQHEDNAMLLRWDSENLDPNSPDGVHLSSVRTPHPDWAGPNYDVNEDGTPGATYKLPTADTGSKDVSEAKSFILPASFGQPRVNSGDAP
jgi:FtsP/CotA-like multicopper oxidase with cupredoxin domain